ncbi:MAG: bifunctional metallophosphatase/5'-nucleotidase [Planctomycetes bacterium]|nr:bifunctional metallophosphatase/5'-nucleotidase [Planctomycetota bacterium]
MRRRDLATLLVAVGLFAGTPALAQEPREGALRLTVLHTNDLHGQVLEPPRRPGGLVALGRAIRQERDRARERGDAVLLLDAGDLFKGTPEGDLTDGEVMVAWMNHMGYDAAVVGNHEFDHGVDVAARLCWGADFPFLGANIRQPDGARPEWLGLPGARLGEPLHEALRGAAVVRTLASAAGRARVALVGLTTSAMKDVTLKGVTGDLEFPDEAATLDRVLELLPPVDLVVLITHCGLTTDRALARRFQGKVDLIIGGHSHTRLPSGDRQGAVLVCQTGSRGEALGRVRVEVTPAQGGSPRKVVAEADLLPTGDELPGVLAPYIEKVKEKVGARVGTLTRDLERGRGFEPSGLGNLHVDAMRRATGVDVALHNRTGIRADIPAGEVQVRHLYEVAPFGNTVVTLLLSGKDLLELFSGMLGSPSRVLEVSGAVITFDPEAPVGQRLVEVTIGGKPLDPDRTYKVATNNFLAAGGDGHAVFTRGADVRDTGVILLDLLLAHFREREGPFDPGVPEQRLVVAQPAGAPR